MPLYTMTSDFGSSTSNFAHASQQGYVSPSSQSAISWNDSLTESKHIRGRGQGSIEVTVACETSSSNIFGSQSMGFGAGALTTSSSPTKKWLATVLVNLRSRIAHVQERIQLIHSFAQLPMDWDGYNAFPIPAAATEQAVSIVRELGRHQLKLPESFPTGRRSVQLEYEKASGEYLEFEIFDDRIELFWMDADDNVLRDERVTSVEAIAAVERFFA